MVKSLEAGVAESKKAYSDALRNLEEISEAIHQRRLEMRNEAELGVRSAGVGSESPSPPPTRGMDHVAIDGQSVHLVSSCNSGDSPTTVNPAQFSVSQDSSHKFLPPSVIYSSPEKARTESYRRAIGASVADDINFSEDMSANLDDEYLSLPSGSSPRGNDDVFSRSGSSNHYKQGTVCEASHTMSTSPSERGQKSPKLKGLILTPVGAGLDPLQANLRIQTKPNVAKAQSEVRRPSSYPYSHNTEQNSRISPLDAKTFSSEVIKQRVTTPTSEKNGRRLLKVPSMQDCDEGSISDTESTTSGTMLDDDQVEFLTMDFSKQKFDDTADETYTKDFRRMSLPEALNYGRKTGHAREHDIAHRDSTDLDK